MFITKPFEFGLDQSPADCALRFVNFAFFELIFTFAEIIS